MSELEEDHYYATGYAVNNDAKAIKKDLEHLFAELSKQNNYRGLNAEQFSNHGSIFLNRLNYIHPFREGNGRTQRLLLTQIAHQAGFSITWSSISSDAMKNACIAGNDGSDRAMQRLLLFNLEPISLPLQSKIQISK